MVTSSDRPFDAATSRRAVLGVILGAGLAGCGREAGTAAGSTTPTRSPAQQTGTPTPSPTDTTSPSPSPSPSPSASASLPAPLESRESIIARYSGRAPSQWGTSVTGVVSRTPSTAVVLTFDACGGPNGSGYDEALISTVRRHQVPATLFLNSRWITANPGLAAELAADPLLEVANHGVRHVPLSVDGRAAYGIAGTANVGEIYDELAGGVAWFTTQIGHGPRWFRPGTAHTDDIGAAIALDLGQPVAGFSVNGDAGATFTAGQVAQTLSGVRPGDVVISHFNQPGRGTAAGYATALPQLLERGVTFASLTGAMS